MNREREILKELEVVVSDRSVHTPEGSYTATLFNEGLSKISNKINEEALEVILALNQESPERAVSEIADLIYHLTVGLVFTGKGSWGQVLSELERRRDL